MQDQFRLPKWVKLNRLYMQERFRIDDLTGIVDVAYFRLIGIKGKILHECFRIASKDGYAKQISFPRWYKCNQSSYAGAIPVAQTFGEQPEKFGLNRLCMQERFRIDDLTGIVDVAYFHLIGNQRKLLHKCFRINGKDFLSSSFRFPNVVDVTSSYMQEQFRLPKRLANNRNSLD